MTTITKEVDVVGNTVLGPRRAFIDFPAILRPNFSAVRNNGGAGAVLVDCEVVRRRKQELQSLSPADLKKLIGERAFDESSIEIPLCDLVDLPTILLPRGRGSSSVPDPQQIRVLTGGRRKAVFPWAIGTFICFKSSRVSGLRA
jgi:hypothetical protein